ncbi:hypothetical protein KKC44_03780, partial [Patescibacteria group bacterium]|nr:hypothetical protein [Patescibacteria group bacterium]
PPMQNVLHSLRKLNAVIPGPSTSEMEFLAEEFSGSVPSAALPDDLNTKIIKVSTNTNQKLIVVTHDKTLLCLKRNISRLGKNGWIAPLSTVTTIILALITSDFKTALWLGPSEWKAMFVISGFLSTGWLAFMLKKSVRSKTTNEVTYDIVQQLGGVVNGMN